MKKFTITNGQNQKINVDLVRYFKFKNDHFLIYTMNEYDEKNYVKLYLVRIMEELGFPIVQTIRNDADWSSMQGIVKKVLKEIKTGKRKLLEDLKYDDIVGIKVVEPRYFKLESKLTDILASNYLENEFTENNDDVSKNESTIIVDNLNSLESIDETIEKQGKFEPGLTEKISSNSALSPINKIMNNIDSNVSFDNNDDKNIEEVKPITSESNNISYNNSENSENSNELSNKNPELISIAKPNSIEKDSISSKKVETSNEDNIDYKSLYMAVKKENETSAVLIDNLMNQLLNYKQKYGELEEIEN